jgi:hypothetical protein
MNKNKLVDIKQLSEELGPSVRTIRNWMWFRKIPYIRFGHRQCLFDVAKVRAAIEKFEIRAVVR